MLRVSPCMWRGYLGLRIDPGPVFQQRIQEAIETLQAFGYGITEPDDRNIVIRDVKTISRLYPTEYAAVLGPSRPRQRCFDRMAADDGVIHYSLRFLNRRNARHYDWKSAIAAEGWIAEKER